MIQSFEDKYIKQSITESLDMLVENLQNACEQLRLPKPTEYDCLEMIASVAREMSVEVKMVESIL